MITKGRAKSDQRGRYPTGQLGVAFAVMIAVAVSGMVLSEISRIRTDQRIARRASADCERSYQKEICKSSVASLRSAIASEEAVNLASWQTLFSAVGVAGLLFTVLYARAAWREAAASVEVAEDTAKRQLRAYVIIATAKIVDIGNYRKRTLVISTENFGATPAKNVRIWRQVVFKSFPFDRDFDHSFPEGIADQRDVIGPGQRQGSQLKLPIRLSRSLLRQFLLKKSTFYVYGRITYSDVFDVEHTTDFRFRATGDKPGSMQADARGNSMS